MRKETAKQRSERLQLYQLYTESGEYVVTLRNNRELRIPEHFSEKRVRQLIELLETC